MATSALSGLDLLATAVMLVDEPGFVRYMNPAAENLFGLSNRSAEGEHLESVFKVSFVLTAAMGYARDNNCSYSEHGLTLSATGHAVVHLSCTVTPVEVDTPGGFLFEFRHTEQEVKIAREERMLDQSEANRELIRNLAHEIKNPLGGIRGAAQLLERELDRPQLSEYTQVIIGEADRLQSLVNRLLTPHRLPNYRRTNVHELLVRVKGVVQAEFPAIPIVADFDTSLPEIEADPEQLTQAVLNIVRNAAQAVAGTTSGPVIRLTTRVARYVTLARKRHRLAIAMAIEDNGPGIPPSIRERIFYPLVSGRPGGSGLGLTIAQTFIAQHNGAIECESEPGNTVFRILLPLETQRQRT